MKYKIIYNLINLGRGQHKNGPIVIPKAPELMHGGRD